MRGGMTAPMSAQEWMDKKNGPFYWRSFGIHGQEMPCSECEEYAAYRVREALEENEAEVKALREALGKMQGYARHKGGCAMMRPLRVDEQIPECDCGFSTLYRAAILAAAEEATR